MAKRKTRRRPRRKTFPNLWAASPAATRICQLTYSCQLLMDRGWEREAAAWHSQGTWQKPERPRLEGKFCPWFNCQFIINQNMFLFYSTLGRPFRACVCAGVLTSILFRSSLTAPPRLSQCSPRRLAGSEGGSSQSEVGVGWTEGSFTLSDEIMWYQTHDSLITLNFGLGTLKTRSGRGKRRIEGWGFCLEES